MLETCRRLRRLRRKRSNNVSRHGKTSFYGLSSRVIKTKQPVPCLMFLFRFVSKLRKVRTMKSYENSGEWYKYWIKRKFQVPPLFQNNVVYDQPVSTLKNEIWNLTLHRTTRAGGSTLDASGHLDGHVRTAFHARVARGFLLPSFSHLPAPIQNL